MKNEFNLESGEVKDETLKYHRVEGILINTIQSDRITCLSIAEESVALGTEEGFVHIISLNGDIVKSFKSHDRSINDISIDNSGTTIASCSDNGSVILLYLGAEGEKETVYHLNEPIKCVCVEDDPHSKRDRCFVVGGVSGQLIHHRQVWFTQKNVTLFNGAESPVSCISWRGNIIAWSDSNQIRLMDISTRTAICYLNSPSGVSSLNPYPCTLFWESDSELMIGWADNFRFLQLTNIAQAGQESTNANTIIAKTVVDWQADVIICGISNFDDENIILLGYVPPGVDSDEADSPEIQIINKNSGELVSVDVLPILGTMSRGPWSYHMASDYKCFSRRQDSYKWNYNQSKTVRGGSRGLSPTCFLTSGQDFIIIRVRDINDRIHRALEHGDLRAAVRLAFSDRTSLRQYQLHDLLTLYIENLLDTNQSDLASEECKSLIGKDAILWERWILAFLSRNQLKSILKYIPITSPRLPSSVYEVVLEDLLQKNTIQFLETVKEWCTVNPPLFDHKILALRLETAQNLDEYCLEAQAILYTIARQFDKAIHAYLEIEGEHKKSKNNKNVTKSSTNKPEEIRDFKHIFEMIERENLFDTVSEKLANLFRLSRENTEYFLLRNLDKLPIKVVVKQLLNDRICLYWYLHLIYTNCHDIYNTAEYADYHIMQVSLYAEFSPHLNYDKIFSSTLNGFDLIKKQNVVENNFILFLKTSSFVPLPLALKECEKRSPPLYYEMVYILAKMDAKKEALGLLLREIGSAYEAIQFVESQDTKLWPDLVEYSLRNSDFLVQLLDYLGICNLDPYLIVSKIPKRSHIPNVRAKALQIVNQYEFQLFLNDICNDVLEHDALSLLNELNKNRRKAIRVLPQTLRCKICSRLLYLPHGSIPKDESALASFHSLKSELFQVWGKIPHCLDHETIVFSNKTSFHRYCYDTIYGKGELKQSMLDEDDDEEDKTNDILSIL